MLGCCLARVVENSSRNKRVTFVFPGETWLLRNVRLNFRRFFVAVYIMIHGSIFNFRIAGRDVSMLGEAE